jgi:hypothetical protein
VRLQQPALNGGAFVFLVGHRAAGNVPAPVSALDALLATEQEIAAELARAERESAAVIAAAHADADASLREAATSLSAELGALEARDASARDAMVRRLEDEAARLSNRYRTLAEPEVERLAAIAVRDVTGLDAGQAP